VCSEHDNSHVGAANCVAFSPNGLYVASGSGDGTVHIRDGQTGKLISVPPTGHTSLIFGVQFSPSGSHIVSCSYDATIRFWDASLIGTRLQKQNTRGSGEWRFGSLFPHGFIHKHEKNAGIEASNSQKIDIDSEWLSLDGDGWVVDSYGRRLVWVPPDLRTYLVLSSTSSIITDKGYYRLEISGRMIGDKWMECYNP
jgi:WD40 repeat protein